MAWCRIKARTANRPKLVSGRPANRITPWDVIDILIAAQGRCHHCGSLAVERRPSKPNGAPLPWEAIGRRIGSLEHVVPLAGEPIILGLNEGTHGAVGMSIGPRGTNTVDNLVWACLWCNTWPDERVPGAIDHGGYHEPEPCDEVTGRPIIHQLPPSPRRPSQSARRS